ncbi:MAG: FAD-binding oxidoreductase [Nitrososphaerales archaeon]
MPTSPGNGDSPRSTFRRADLNISGILRRDLSIPSGLIIFLKYNAIIIGSGIAGLSTAYHLGNGGMHDILVVDKSSLGGGSTAWASGVISHLFPDMILINLVKESVRFFHEIEQLSNFKFNQVGMLSVGNSSNEILLKQAHRLLQSANVKAVLMNEENMRRKFPRIITKDLELGVYCTESGYLDQNTLVRTLSSMLRQNGVSIKEHAIVNGLITHNSKVSGVIIEDKIIESERIIIASGIWSRSLGKRMGYHLPLSIYRTQAIQIGLSQPTEIPIFYDLTTGQYGGPIDELTIILGDGSTGFDGEIDTAGNSGDDLFARETLVNLKARIRNIQDPRVLGSWSGLYCTTRDGRPLVGESETIQGLYYICGFQGLGLTLAPGSGQYLAEIINGKNQGEANPFRAERL